MNLHFKFFLLKFTMKAISQINRIEIIIYFFIIFFSFNTKYAFIIIIIEEFKSNYIYWILMM